MTPVSQYAPKSMIGQMIAVLTVSFAILLSLLTALEVLYQDNAIEWAENDLTLSRLKRTKPVLEFIRADQLDEFLDLTSFCHEGYTLTDAPFEPRRSSPATDRIEARVVKEMTLNGDQVRVSHAILTREDFSYSKCDRSSIDLPVEGVVISLMLRSGKWFNVEVHPHEWHVNQSMVDWLVRASGAFFLVGAVAVFFMRRLSAPLANLTTAAQRFGKGLKFSPVTVSGPPDLKRAIESFNAMQQQVTDEVGKRINTLAAISHDVRTPLTSLRIKAELLDDDVARQGFIDSIDKMEKITASALEFLRGESLDEPKRAINLSTLVDSECSDLESMSPNISYTGPESVQFVCRPEAIARALRNLIENAVKYGNGANVELSDEAGFIELSVLDNGPGIPEEKTTVAVEPFERLSSARESIKGGFGLGLAVVKAIAESHGGSLVLRANKPTGLIATIRLPGKANAADR